MENRQLEAIKDLPIGFMDSGMGGISVLRQAVKIMPNEDYIYYGDSLHAPYGVKEVGEIRYLTFQVVEKLLKMGIKGLAVACNTATGAAVRQLRLEYPELPIVGIEPAVKPAVTEGHGGRVIVLATPMTIRQTKYKAMLEKYQDQAEIVSVPCDGLMEFVEQGIIEGEEVRRYFERHLTPELLEDAETIVLGCTHYPFLTRELNRFLEGRNIRVIDGSFGTAMELKRRLRVKGLLREEERTGKVTIYNSSEKQEMIDLSYRLLHLP